MAVYLVLGITFGFAAAVQPGPLQTFLISRTLNRGWRHTLPAACAPLVSDIPIVTLVLLLLSTIPLWMENLLHFAGGLFVLFLAYGAFKSFKNYDFQKMTKQESRRQNFFKAVAVNLLNPNPYLAWSLVMGPLFLKSWREATASGVALIVSFYVTMVVVTAGIILVFSAVRRLGPGVNRVLIGISVIALAGFGLYELWLGIWAVWLS